MIIRNVIKFIVLVLLQVLVLDHINFSGYLNPNLYVLFILLLPLNTPRWALLISAFSLGFCIDVFSNTYGLHAAASVLMAYARPAVLKLLESGKEYEPDMVPGIKDLGFTWFFSYSIILVGLHHFALIFLEALRLYEFLTTFYRFVLSTLFTLLLVIITQYLFYQTSER